jgi:hypothetical protein
MWLLVRCRLAEEDADVAGARPRPGSARIRRPEAVACTRSRFYQTGRPDRSDPTRVCRRGRDGLSCPELTNLDDPYPDPLEPGRVLGTDLVIAVADSLPFWERVRSFFASSDRAWAIGLPVRSGTDTTSLLSRTWEKMTALRKNKMRKRSKDKAALKRNLFAIFDVHEWDFEVYYYHISGT